MLDCAVQLRFLIIYKIFNFEKNEALQFQIDKIWLIDSTFYFCPLAFEN